VGNANDTVHVNPSEGKMADDTTNFNPRLPIG
jgi:hypothetical protein